MGLATGGINEAISKNIQAGNTEAKGAGVGGPAGNLAGDDQPGQRDPFALSAGLSFDVAKTHQRSDIDTDQDASGGQVFGSDNQTNVSVS